MAVLVRWEPWRMARELERNVDRLLRWDVGPWMGMSWQWVVPLSEEDRWAPAYDMFARAGDLVVRIELPGIDPAKDVQVTVQDGYYRRESSYGAFERGIPLPEGAKFEDIMASYDNGVLEVVMPKAAPASPAHADPRAGPQRQEGSGCGRREVLSRSRAAGGRPGLPTRPPMAAAVGPVRPPRSRMRRETPRR